MRLYVDKSFKVTVVLWDWAVILLAVPVTLWAPFSEMKRLKQVTDCRAFTACIKTAGFACSGHLVNHTNGLCSH